MILVLDTSTTTSTLSPSQSLLRFDLSFILTLLLLLEFFSMVLHVAGNYSSYSSFNGWIVVFLIVEELADETNSEAIVDLFDGCLKWHDLASSKHYLVVYYATMSCFYGLGHVILREGGFELELKLIERLSYQP